MSDKKPMSENMSMMARIREWVRDCGDGSTWSWFEIEQVLGIGMTESGKQAVRTACHREKRVYSPIWGNGIVFSEADTASEITHASAVKVLGAMQVTQQKASRLIGRHGEHMLLEDKERLTMTVCKFGAIATAYEESNNVLVIRYRGKKS